MVKKATMLNLVFIIILFFTSTATSVRGPSDDRINEQKRKTIDVLSELHSAFFEDLNQARETVKMLDDLYKSYIVFITSEYVNNPLVLPAATLSKRVFEEMSKKGWHKARLLDATGTPFNPENNPKDKFERDAINALVSGKSYFERVETVEGKEYLRAATSVRAVIKGCTICHPDKKVGDLLGAISYGIPLEE